MPEELTEVTTAPSKKEIRRAKRRGLVSSMKLTASGIIAGVVLSIGATSLLNSNHKQSEEAPPPTITSSYISGKLESVSELTTAELTYNGILTYEDGKIPILTKTGFSMYYTSVVKAGVDISQVKVNVEPNKVTIYIPETEILMVKVDPNSIEFYNEKHALLSGDEKRDVTEAIAAAEADVEANADLEALMDRAETQTRAIIQSILQDCVGDRKIVIKRQ